MKKNKSIFSVATFVAISFTFLACSSGGGSGGGGSSPSSGGGGGSSIHDSRDSKNYKTVVIGTQTWMAENLNYNADGSVCYDDKSSNCITYGRLYDWATAMTVCPSGWHLPTREEWATLENYVGGSSTAGRYLKATSGWNDYLGVSGNGKDTYGFAALPGGNGYSDGSFDSVGNYGFLWSASEFNANNAYYRSMYYNHEGVNTNYGYKSNLFSVRCLQD